MLNTVTPQIICDVLFAHKSDVILILSTVTPQKIYDELFVHTHPVESVELHWMIGLRTKIA